MTKKYFSRPIYIAPPIANLIGSILIPARSKVHFKVLHKRMTFLLSITRIQSFYAQPLFLFENSFYNTYNATWGLTQFRGY